jgi:hypothetical protein
VGEYSADVLGTGACGARKLKGKILGKSAKFYVKLCRLLFSVVVLGLFASVSAESLQSVADTVIVNARTYTVNRGRPWAEAIAIRGNQILAVGSAEENATIRRRLESCSEPNKVANTEVLLTLVGGKVVNQGPAWPAASAAAEVKW